MRFLKVPTLLAVMYGALSLFFVSCTSNEPEVTPGEVTGDYLFDRKDILAVFYTVVYEKDGALLAQSDLADYPVEMVRLETSPPVYRITFKSVGDFNLTFGDKRDGRYNRVTMASNNSDFSAEGRRRDDGGTALRDNVWNPDTDYAYRAPVDIGDGLKTGRAGDTGLDEAAIGDVVRDIAGTHDYMHSLLVIKNGQLVIEEYFNGWDPVRLHRLQSVTKSVTSALVGLAIQQGLIGNVADPVHQYVPRYARFLEGEKRSITIEHLLTMSAGFKWNEAATYYAAPDKCDAHLAEASGDFIKYVLEKPLASHPGEVYDYNSGYPNILGHIIVERSGMNLVEYAFKYLFEPLGIERAYWSSIHGEREYRPGCAGGLRLTSRDMAKIGLLYLRDGVWNGERILSEEWVRESVTDKMDSENNTHYGYQWKTTTSLDGTRRIFFASGTGGQFIACVPSLDAVVVTTAKFNKANGEKIAKLLLTQVLPAISAQ